MELIPTQNETVVDGVAHQVDAGSHDKRNDADVDCRARQRLWTAFNQLRTDSYSLDSRLQTQKGHISPDSKFYVNNLKL